jgi:hypothetical protein
MAAATGTTDTASSSSSAFTAAGAHVPMPPTAPNAPELGAPIGTVGNDQTSLVSNHYDPQDTSGSRLLLDTQTPQAKLFPPWREPSGAYGWTWTLRFLHVRSGTYYRLCMPCQVEVLPSAHKDGTVFVARFAFLVKGGHWYLNLAALPGTDDADVLVAARPVGVGTPKLVSFGPYQACWADSAHTAVVASINERVGKLDKRDQAMDVDAADSAATTADTAATTAATTADTTTAEGRARKRGRKEVAPPTVPSTPTAPVASSSAADASVSAEMRVQIEWLQQQLQAARDSVASKDAQLMHEKVERAKAETQLQALQALQQSQGSTGSKATTRSNTASSTGKGGAATIPPAVPYLATAVQQLKEAGTALRSASDTAIKVGQTLCKTTQALKETDFKALAREGADEEAVTKFDAVNAKYDTAIIMASMTDPNWAPPKSS